MNQRSILLSVMMVALSILLCSRLTFSTTSKDHAPEVEFHLEKLSEADMAEEDTGIMHNIKQNLYAAKEAIASKFTELTGGTQSTTDDVSARAADVTRKMSDQATETKDSMYESVKGVGERVSHMMHEAKDKLKGAQDVADEKIQDAKHTTKKQVDTASVKASEARDRVAANLEETKDATKARLYSARDATVDAKDRAMDASNSMLSEAYERMKEAYEALNARMAEARASVTEAAYDAKENAKDAVNTARDKAGELAHDTKAKYHEAAADMPQKKTAKTEVDEPGMFADAYHRMKLAFDELSAKMRREKSDDKIDLYEAKEDDQDRGMMSEWYQSMRSSFDDLSNRMKDLTGRSEVESHDTKDKAKLKRENDDEASRGQVYGMMTDLYNRMQAAYQRLPGVASSSTTTDRHTYRTQTVDSNSAGVREKIQDAMDYIQDKYHDAKNEVQDRYHDTKNEVQDRYHDAKNEGKERYHDAKHETQDRYHHDKNEVKDAEPTRNRASEILEDAKDHLKNVGDRISEAVGMKKDNQLEGECINRGKGEENICISRTSAEAAKAGATAAALHDAHGRK